MQHRIHSLSVVVGLMNVAGLTTGGCGVGGDASESGAIATGQSAQEQALVANHIFDLDAVYGHPATRNFLAVANDANSPCRSLATDALDLGEKLAPAILAKNYGAVAAALPQILHTLADLFACVKTARANDSSSTPLPEAPALPVYEATHHPCVTVIWRGSSAPTCP